MGGERGSTSGLRFNPRESEERPTEEAGELAGQVGQADAIEGANPHGNGLGMGVMTGEPMDMAFDSIKKKDEPKYDTDKPKKTTTIDTVRARAREKKGRKRRSGKTVTIESKKKTRKSKAGNPLRVDTGLNPGGYTGVMASHRASQPSVQYSSQTQTRPNYLSLFSGRSKPKTSYSDPRGREAESQRADMAATQPTQRITPSIPTVRADSRIVHAPRGSAEHRDATMGPKKTHTPRKPDTPMGEGHSKAHDLASGGASMFAPILAKGQSGINRHEYRRIVQKLEKLLRDLTNKMDASLDPAPDGPTPNAGPRMTSAPTGATETDPDDDPTMWGAHAYGLYTRRGGL